MPKLHWCPCTHASACFSVTAFGALGRQQNIAQTQTKLVSLHGYFWLLLLGHHTRGSCKTRQHGSRSNKLCALVRTSCFFSVIAFRAPARQGNVAQGQTSFVSLCGRFLFLLGHCIEGSCKTRQRGSGSKIIRVLAQVPPVASRSPANSRALQNHKKHWCPCTGTSGCFSLTTLGAPARQGNVAQGQTSLVSLHKCPRLLLGHHLTYGSCKATQHC